MGISYGLQYQLLVKTRCDRPNTVCMYKGILFSHRKECCVDVCYNMATCQKHDTERKKQDKKGHVS